MSAHEEAMRFLKENADEDTYNLAAYLCDERREGHMVWTYAADMIGSIGLVKPGTRLAWILVWQDRDFEVGAEFEEMQHRPVHTYLVGGQGYFGTAETLEKAKANFKRFGGRLMGPHTVVKFREGTEYIGVNAMGAYSWNGPPPIVHEVSARRSDWNRR